LPAGFLGSLTKDPKFEFAHRALQAQQEAIVEEPRIIDFVSVNHEENKVCARLRILFDLHAHHGAEPLETLAQIARLCCQADFDAVGENHIRAPAEVEVEVEAALCR
jgi:hypothetical protein